MPTRSWTGIVVGIVMGIVTGIGNEPGIVARARTDERCRPAPAAVRLPPNIEILDGLAPELQSIYRRSPSFRAQCARISRAEHLKVRIQLDLDMPSFCRVYTRFSRQGRILHAEVRVPPASYSMAELVGHEFEHIVEQIEAIDLRSLADVRGSGVMRNSVSFFETIRAQKVGRLVALETRARGATD